jgi:RES domain-containing protein
VELVTFRAAAYETPLWAISNPPGRYNRDGAGATQYLSLHPMTPWAELLRAEDLRTRDEAFALRAPLWAIKVVLDDPPEEITFDNAGDYGLDPQLLVSDDWDACQALGEGLRGTTTALIAPSAALPGTRNLVVLSPAVVVPYESEPIDREDLPTALTTQDGQCAGGLWDLVHYRGAEVTHAALEAWSSGDDYLFEEPTVSPGPFGVRPT